jgi:hypothetical protein
VTLEKLLPPVNEAITPARTLAIREGIFAQEGDSVLLPCGEAERGALLRGSDVIP